MKHAALVAALVATAALATDDADFYPRMTFPAGGSPEPIPVQSGTQIALQCNQRVRYRTCRATPCVATDYDALVEVEPRMLDICVPALHRFLSIRGETAAGRCTVFRVVPRTVCTFLDS